MWPSDRGRTVRIVGGLGAKLGERVRDTATLKTLGMSPRQVIGMVATSAGFLALQGGLVAVPAGVALYRPLFDQLSHLGGNITPSVF